VKALLNAADRGSYQDDGTTLERRLGDLLWYSDVRFPTGAVDSLLGSGRAAAIDDIELRAYLADYPRMAAHYSAYGLRDQRVVLEVLAPFLSRKTSLLQLSNLGFIHGRPGDGSGADPAQVVPVSNPSNLCSRIPSSKEFWFTRCGSM
jgi:hypothetical protein